MSCHLIVLLICRFKAGASGAATSAAQLQAYAGGGFGLAKGEHGNHAGLKNTPGFSLGIEVGTEATGPGMCDFPFRQESGAGNRIPGGFFAYVDLRSSSHWQGIVRKRPLLLLRCSVLACSRKQVPPRHERAKKRQTPVGDRQYIETYIFLYRPVARGNRTTHGPKPPRPKAGPQRETAARSPSGYIIPLKNITLGDFFIYYGQFRYAVCE